MAHIHEFRLGNKNAWSWMQRPAILNIHLKGHWDCNILRENGQLNMTISLQKPGSLITVLRIRFKSCHLIKCTVASL